MGNKLNASTDLAARSFASGQPQELDWHELLTQFFRPSHNAILLLTPDKERVVVEKQPCKIIECLRAREEGLLAAEFDPAFINKRVGIVSQKGKKTGPNQDAAFFLTFRDGDGADVWMACVMDGHGPLGHEMSRLCMQWLPLLMVREPSMAVEVGRLVPSDPQAIFSGVAAAFEKMGPLIARASSGTAQKEMSGTTCVFAIYSRGLLHTANVGDSRAVLGLPQTGRETSSLQLNIECLDLTRDHKPNDVEEKARIEAHGGEVRENRVWLREPPWVGLNLSRSFGDSLVHRVGVSCEADVAAKFLDDEVKGRFIILASDGVWEFISSSDAVESIAGHMSFTSVPEATNRLVRRATDCWHSNCANERDDITVIVVQF